MYIIVTVENELVNLSMIKELKEFIPTSNIINLSECYNRTRLIGGWKTNQVYGEGCLLKNFLPLKKIKETNSKVKVRISHSFPSVWNTISTLCKAFSQDDFFDLLIVIDECKFEIMSEQVEACGYKYVRADKYSGHMDKPDILVLTGHFNKMSDGMLDAREYVKLTVVPYWSVVRYDDSMEAFWKRINKDLGIYSPDYYFFDSLQFRDIKESVFYTEKVVEMGNAKYDRIYNAIQNKNYPPQWEKLKGKKTVLWTVTHGYSEEEITRTFTFDLYAKVFFDYAMKHQDMGFIFRPAITFINEMLKYGFWSRRDLKYFEEYCIESTNIVFDNLDTYDNSFALADGILTDAFGGIVCSALPTLKPICAVYRSKDDIPWHKELLTSLYSAYNDKDFLYFLEMVRKGQDPMLEQRKEICAKCVKFFDGKNGQRMKDFIKMKYQEIEKEYY